MGYTFPCSLFFQGKVVFWVNNFRGKLPFLLKFLFLEIFSFKTKGFSFLLYFFSHPVVVIVIEFCQYRDKNERF